MWIKQNFLALTARLSLDRTDFHTMNNFLKTMPFMEHIITNVISPDYRPKVESYFKIKNSDYYLLFTYEIINTTSGYSFYLTSGLNKDPNLVRINTVAGGEGSTVTVPFNFLFTDNLLIIKYPHKTDMSSSIEYLKLCKFTDGKFYSVDPFVGDLSGFTFDKTFYTKTTLQNQNILVPARLKNTQSKIINIYPTSCYYTSGLIDNTYYKFLDGEYGYYKNNILYK